MIRGRLRIWGIVVLMMIFIFFTIGRVNTVTYINGEKGIPPTPSNYKYNSTVFYINSDLMLEKELRSITIYHNEIVEAILRELKKQPTNNNLKPVVDPDVRVLSSEIINKKLYLDLSGDILDSSLWRIGYHKVIIYAMVNSFTQFDTIERVQIKIDGKDINAYVDETEIFGEMSYNDSLIFTEPASSRESVEQFLNYVMIERYDLAFAMTTLFGRADMATTDFERQMSIYRQHKMSYMVTQTFVNEEEEGMSVLVNYEYYDRMRNVAYDGGVEEWFLERDEDGVYRIKWPRLVK